MAGDGDLHDANQALKAIKAGTACGYKVPLYGRAVVESTFELLGKLITSFLPFVATLLLCAVVLICALLCIGFVNSELETDAEDLWVEKGGRLDVEIEYTDDHLDEGFDNTQELIVQEVYSDNFTLTLLDHLYLLKAITEFNTTYRGMNFQFRDVCAIAVLSVPNVPELQRIADMAAPCLFLTPIDCYWEGSILQEPDVLVQPPQNTDCLRDSPTNNETALTWGNLNIDILRRCLGANPSETGYTMFTDQGIQSFQLSGFLDRSCISVESCPPGLQVADPVYEPLRNGCRSYTDLVFEPQSLIIAGYRFETDVPGAAPSAIRSSVLLNGPATIQESLLSNRNISLTRSQVEELLARWKDKFFDLVIRFNEEYLVDIGSGQTYRKASVDQIFGWTSETLDDITEEYSGVSPALILIGYCLMISYCGIAFVYLDWVNSHASVGLMGLALVALASAAALGLTAACGVPFNITTTQIFPFLVLGLGVDDMFVIGDAFFETEYHMGRDTDIKTLLKATLRAVGPSVTLTSITNACGFFLSAVIPIPVIRAFAIQVGCAVVFNYFALLIGLSSFIVLDHYRVKANLVDFFCCFPASLCCHPFRGMKESEIQNKDKKEKEAGGSEEEQGFFSGIVQRFRQYKSPLTAMVVEYYSPFLQNYIVKVIVIVVFSIWFGFTVWGCTKVEDGLDIDDVVPKGTVEHGFARANIRNFAAYPSTIVTKDINYPNRNVQQALLQMSEEINTARYVEHAEQLTGYWLKTMITFFDGLENVYRNVYCTGDAQTQALFQDAAFVYYLVHQSFDSSVNSTILQGFVFSCDSTVRRLVEEDDNGLYIPPDRFYQYIPLWVSLDNALYTLNSPSFDPRPPNLPVQALAANSSIGMNYGPILYAEQFILSEGLSETSDFENFINEIRDIVGSYERFGIYGYPRGPPFLFWEQYINLRQNVALACGLILVACFVATSFFLMDIWSATILVSMLALISAEVFGVTGFLEIKFSSIPAIMIIASVGVSVEFTAPLTFYFLKAAPNPGKKEMNLFGFEFPAIIATWFVTRNERMHKALEHRFTPVFNGSITTFLGIIMLAFAELPFIRLYFFSILMSIVLLGMLNGLILLPVILSLFGPPAQAYPKQDSGNGIPLDAKNQSYDEMNVNHNTVLY